MEPSELQKLITHSERQVFSAGFNLGFLTGWQLGAEAQRKHIMGESDQNPLEEGRAEAALNAYKIMAQQQNQQQPQPEGE